MLSRRCTDQVIFEWHSGRGSETSISDSKEPSEHSFYSSSSRSTSMLFTTIDNKYLMEI